MTMHKIVFDPRNLNVGFDKRPLKCVKCRQRFEKPPRNGCSKPDTEGKPNSLDYIHSYRPRPIGVLTVA
jgi:hypothetical protein